LKPNNQNLPKKRRGVLVGYLSKVYYSTIGQLSYLGEISFLEHFNETASCSTIGQLSYLGEISFLEHFNETASCSTMGKLSYLGEISVIEHFK